MCAVLLTEASGYIGKHIALLFNQGYSLRASVRSLTKSAEVRNAVADRKFKLPAAPTGQAYQVPISANLRPTIVLESNSIFTQSPIPTPSYFFA